MPKKAKNKQPKSTNQIKQDQKYEVFPITSVCRADLEHAGFDVKNVDDSTMVELASKMADAYCDLGFWEDLEILAEHLGIKKDLTTKKLTQ